MTLEEIDKRLDCLSDFIRLRTDIVCNNPNWWMGSAYYELPTFEGYIKNCVEDRGGSYDFTVRRYRSPLSEIKDVYHCHERRNIDIVSYFIEYSMWMGTPFNHKLIIENNDSETGNKEA